MGLAREMLRWPIRRRYCHRSRTIDGDVIRILPATSYSHTKLSAKEEWSYQVYAFNRFGHSETTSGERTVETKAANDPTAPEDLFVLQAEKGPKLVEL